EVGGGRSPVTKKSESVVVEHSVKRSIIAVSGVADFEIVEGRRISVWPAPGAATRDMEIFLFGPAWATLCHQRGLLPLHASAILTANGIAAIVGHSGAGKSTSAAWLTKMGYELVADDILPISYGANSRPGAWPYLRRFKLHRDVITELGWLPIQPVGASFDKHKFFVSPIRSCDDQWRRLDRIYLIQNEMPGSQLQIEPLSGADAVAVLLDHTYRFDFIRDTRKCGAHLELCARLASQVEIYRIHKPATKNPGEMVSATIHQHIENANLITDNEAVPKHGERRSC
ncbi:MAG TPA: hypothetical protein VFM32_09685, partial [Spongiibacteraceae bacterium]|nr:hypothetical protein [Spongiibacteraceae bacterium]